MVYTRQVYKQQQSNVVIEGALQPRMYKGEEGALRGVLQGAPLGVLPAQGEIGRVEQPPPCTPAT